MPFNRTLIVLAGAMFSIGAAPQPPDPEKIVQQAEQACKRLQSVQYTVVTDMRGTIVNASYLEKRMAGKSSFWVSGEVRDGTGSVEPFEAAFDGRTLLIRGDGGSVRTFEDADEFVMGQQLGQNLMGRLPFMSEFFETIRKEKAKLTYVGKERIGGWSCDVVEFRRKIDHPDRGEVILVTKWAFDEVSRLPVQIKSDSITTTAKSLRINPTVPADAFRLQGKKVKAEPVAPQTEKLLPVGTKAPNFTLRDGSGRARSLEEFRGKVVLIDFWGTWCAPCRKAMPILQGLYAKYRSQGFVVLGISVADKESNPAAFMKRNGYTYQLLVNGDPAAKQYRAVMLPTMYLLDRTGKIVYRQAGTDRKDKERLTGLIENLVKKR